MGRWHDVEAAVPRKAMTMSGQLGIGVLINRLLGSRESVDLSQVIGKVITGIALTDDTLRVAVEGDKTLVLWDCGQSCCEHRYMTSDDTAESFIGATLVDVEIADAPNRDGGGEEHEVQFLRVKTSLGVFTAETHNEHNGYYGGFSITGKIE
jgi:hypothetical protein